MSYKTKIFGHEKKCEKLRMSKLKKMIILHVKSNNVSNVRHTLSGRPPGRH